MVEEKVISPPRKGFSFGSNQLTYSLTTHFSMTDPATAEQTGHSSSLTSNPHHQKENTYGIFIFKRSDRRFLSLLYRPLSVVLGRGHWGYWVSEVILLGMLSRWGMQRWMEMERERGPQRERGRK